MRARSLVLATACILGLSLAVLAEAEPAAADPAPPTCSDQTDACEVEVEIPGADGGNDMDPGTDDGAAPPAGGDADTGDGTDALTDCTSTMLEDATSHPQAGARPNDRSVLVIETCTTETGSTIQSAEWVELGADGQMQLSPELLAQRAVDRLVLLQPRIEASPEAVQLVQLPTWLWVAETTWAVRTAQAAAGGMTATATATPVAISWDMGDGTTVECDGRGSEWEPGTDPMAASDCSHTYTQPSQEELPVSATVTWTVTWVVTDAGGTVASGSEPDMTTAAQTTWPVLESQALVER